MGVPHGFLYRPIYRIPISLITKIDPGNPPHLPQARRDHLRPCVLQFFRVGAQAGVGDANDRERTGVGVGGSYSVSTFPNFKLSKTGQGSSPALDCACQIEPHRVARGERLAFDRLRRNLPSAHQHRSGDNLTGFPPVFRAGKRGQARCRQGSRAPGSNSPKTRGPRGQSAIGRCSPSSRP